ncbi:tyrosine-type recombinase/integrase [Methylocystis rosea]|uniref:tyrosine-type recombinase/integrase n=1 Tax=Methylocystis rosea TaxID=173366 RepID=UPI00039E364F|nr:site-specific integrase [Methylocystis rosea]
MPKQGKHPEKALSALKIRSLREPGRYADGNGLYLVVDPSGAKRWMLRTVVQGRRRDIGLGGTSLVSLAEAREKALSYRKRAREGGDPLAEKRRVEAKPPTFSEAAGRVFDEHFPSWKNSKHASQWMNTLRQYAFPSIGDMPINEVDSPHVLRVLSPIWLSKPETARRVRQRIGTVLSWAKAAGYRTGDNPVEGVAKGLPKQRDRNEHHAAMPFAEVPAFVARLQGAADQGEITRLAIEFLILTAARTGEVLGAKWREIDKPGHVWTIPADRMKAGRAHRVPLSSRCLDILERARLLSAGSEFIFPGRTIARPMSNMVFNMMLRRMDVPFTVHGFRSSFRDWAAERTSYSREICEMALAHTVSNKVEAAYRRTDLFDRRRDLMESWSQLLASDQCLT